MSSSNTSKFRPKNLGAFSQYSKHLAWLLNLSLQRAQELLARIYGWADLHELQQALKVRSPAGPFMGQDRGLDRQRIQRIRDQVQRAIGKDWSSLTMREQASASMALFAPPAVHRERFEMLTLGGMFDDHLAKDVLLTDAYAAHSGVSNYGGLAAYKEQSGLFGVQLTHLGKQVLDQYREIVYSIASDGEYDRRALPLIAEHPDHLWLQAHHLGMACKYDEKQSPWFLGARLGSKEQYDAHRARQMQPERKHRAKALLPELQRVWGLFDTLRSEKLPETLVPRGPQKWDEYYQDFLLYSHYAAFNAGLTDKAIALLEELWQIQRGWMKAMPLDSSVQLEYSDDAIGIRFNLVPLLLSAGRPWEKLFEQIPTDAAWSHFLYALSAYEQGDFAEARARFTETILRCPWFLGLFLENLPIHEGWKLKPQTWRDTPMGCAEFDYRLGGFWKRLPLARKFFADLARNALVRMLELGDAVFEQRQRNSRQSANVAMSLAACWEDRILDVTGCAEQVAAVRSSLLERAS